MVVVFVLDELKVLLAPDAGAVNVTSTPLIGESFSSLTKTTRVEAKVVLIELS